MDKQLPMRLSPVTIEMYDQYIEKLNSEGKGTNRKKLFTEWVQESWVKNCGVHHIPLETHTLYFLTPEARDKALKIVQEYVEKGMKVDEQFVEHLCELAPAYAVKNRKGD